MTEKELFRERKKELEAVKLQLELGVDDLPTFARGLAPWMERKPFTTLLLAGRLEQGKQYLDREIANCEWHLKHHTKEDMLAALGFSRDQIGDPNDKLRRKDGK